MTVPARVPSTSARTALLALGWVIWVLGFGWMGTPVFVFVFGAPLDPLPAFVIAVVTDAVLLAVLIVGAVLSAPRRRGGGSGWWILAIVDILLIAGFAGGYAAAIAASAR
jgi:hypothetical protein